MFSYRHAFHAGNHGDVLKHLTQLAVLRHLMRKPTPLLLVDTHAGAGSYRLNTPAALHSGEAGAGIGRLQALWSEGEGALRTAPALRDYLALVDEFNGAAGGGGGPWRRYPGSPAFAAMLMTAPERAGAHDRLRLFELHPGDHPILTEWVASLRQGRQVTAERADGFDALARLLPPPAGAGGSRRAFVVIDPSYEIKSDYARVGQAVATALRRFATGVVMVWYPIIERVEARRLPGELRALAEQAGRSTLHATLDVGAPVAGAGARGLGASGVVVINRPYTLGRALRGALPAITRCLAAGTGARWTVEDDAK